MCRTRAPVAQAFAHHRVNIRDFLRALPTDSPPRSEVRLLLSRVLMRDAAWLVAYDDYVMTGEEFSSITELVAERVAGQPIAYLLAAREFYGRVFRCSPAALIPRPETELLVDVALTQLPVCPERIEEFDAEPLRILDVGCGTGCIAITLALERPNAVVTAVDISPDALALAQENAQHLGAKVAFVESNWFANLPPDSRFDLIVSNPPYIVPGDAHLSQGDLRFEPAIALADAVDGLESYRQLALGAELHLKAGGSLLVEHGFEQGESVPRLFAAAGWSEIETVHDLAGHPRLTMARSPLRATGLST